MKYFDLKNEDEMKKKSTSLNFRGYMESVRNYVNCSVKFDIKMFLKARLN